jgi:hypothetical protein
MPVAVHLDKVGEDFVDVVQRVGPLGMWRAILVICQGVRSL